MAETASRFGPKGAGLDDSGRDVAGPLLAYLRTQLDGDVAFTETPVQITGGFDTTIYGFRLAAREGDFAGPLIVRIYRGEDAGAQARYEAAIQNAIAAQGFPTPRVVAVCADMAVLGRSFVIMERVPGRVMLESLIGPGIMRLTREAAHLQARLHSLDARPVAAALTDAAVPAKPSFADYLAEVDRVIGAARLDGLRGGARWVAAHVPVSSELVVCHGDLHPLNIMIDGGKVSGVIDWAWGRIDDPASDVGGSVALWTQGPIDLPGFLQPIIDRLRWWLVGRYIKAYTSLRPLDLDAVRYYEAGRLLNFLIEGGEYLQAQAGVIPPTGKPTVFASPRVQASIARRFRTISGVDVSVPSGVRPR